MSEPSLRDTTAQAIGRAYWRSQGQPARAVRASEWYPEADAAFSVIRERIRTLPAAYVTDPADDRAIWRYHVEEALRGV